MINPAPVDPVAVAKQETAELRAARQDGRGPLVVFVPDASGGDPIPWEDPPPFRPERPSPFD